MKMFLYSVQDRLVGFTTITCEVNDQVAYRNFEHAVLEGGNILSSHADDFQLVKLASFDTETGAIEPFSPVHVVCAGSSIVLSSLRRSSDEVQN